METISRFILNPTKASVAVLTLFLILSTAGYSQVTNIGILIQKLGNNDREVRSSAVEELVKIGKPAVEPLINCLTNENRYVREYAAEALGEIGDKRAVEPLIVCLKDEHPYVRWSAAESLGNLGDKRAVEPLIACLKDRYGVVSEYAAKSLGKLGDERAIGPLINSMKNLSAEYCAITIEALGNLGEPAVEPLIACIKDMSLNIDPEGPIKALVNIGKPAVEPLIAFLKEQNVRRTRQELPELIVKALGEIGDERAVEPLIDCLKVKNFYGHTSLIESISKLGKPAVEPLIKCLSDNDPVIRSMAIEALGKIGAKRAVEPLIACLKDQNSRVRATYALSEIGDIRTFDIMATQLKNENGAIRMYSARALGNIGDKRAVDLLIPYIKDEDLEVSKFVADALDKLGYKPTNENERIAFLIAKRDWDQLVNIGKPAVKPLIATLNVRHWLVCADAAETLGRIGDPQAVEPLIASLKHEGANMRKSAAKALGEIGDKKVIPALLSALPDWDANSEICEALGMLGWTPKTDTERVYFWIGKMDKRNLNIYWELVKQVLLIDINQDNERKVENAIFTIIALGREEMIPELIKVLETKGNDVMADTYQRCNNNDLSKAVKKSTKKFNFVNPTRPGFNLPKAFWGSWDLRQKTNFL